MAFANSIPENLQENEASASLVSNYHEEYEFWRPIWRKMRDLASGEDRIKERGTEYLPKLDGQANDQYEAYLKRSVFMPIMSRTLEGLMGSIFQRPPKFNNVPEDLDVASITYDNQSLSQFVKNFTREILHMSRGGILVDVPENGGTPYFAAYQTEQIRNWQYGLRDGRQVVIQVVLYEVTETPYLSGYGTSYNHQYRTLEIVDGVYRQRITFADETGRPVPGAAERIITPLRRGKPLKYIPFIFVNRTDLTPRISKPALLDIGNMNLSHYRSYADLEQGRHYTALPTYWIAGPGEHDDTQFFVGAENLWMLDVDDRCGILEFNGHGLVFLENGVTMKEQQMALLGARIVGQARRVAAEAADTTQLRYKGEQAILLDTTDTINEGLSSALRILVWWHDDIQLTDEEILTISIELNQDFSDGETTPRELRVMQQLHEGGILPLEVLFNVFKASGVVPTYMTVEEFQAMLAKDEQRSDKYDLEIEKLQKQIKLLAAEASKARSESRSIKKAMENPPVEQGSAIPSQGAA
jgi:hypothetical protein